MLEGRTANPPESRTRAEGRDGFDGEKSRQPNVRCTGPNSLRLLRKDDDRGGADGRRQCVGPARAPRERLPRLRRLRRGVRRVVPPPGAETNARWQAPDPSPTRLAPRRVHHWAGPGEAHARRLCYQPLQARLGLVEADRGPNTQGRRGRQEQRPVDRPDRLRQDCAWRRPWPDGSTSRSRLATLPL